MFKKTVVPMQEQYGLRVYADKAFDKVNDKWIVPMLRNVRGADAMLVFVSQSYIESYACFLELMTAVSSKRQLVFVSLEEQLHLGDTTDQPQVERGVKNEILNQGANIATNTNNSSNDLMRAMKSAFTSISTLLEQDALSKYDISDAFINFFRDASINRKTINDLNAIKGTIDSICSRVFDPSVKDERMKMLAEQAEPKRRDVQPAPEMRVDMQAKDWSAPVSLVKERVVHEDIPEAQTVYEDIPDKLPEPAIRVKEQLVPEYQPERQIAPKGRFDLSKIDIHSRNFKLIIAAVLVCCIAVKGIMIGVNSSKDVVDMPYVYASENTGDEFSGTYTGKTKHDLPDGIGTFIFENGSIYTGSWKNGKADGNGTITYAGGGSYTGEWKNGEPKDGKDVFAAFNTAASDSPQENEQTEAEIDAAVTEQVGEQDEADTGASENKQSEAAVTEIKQSTDTAAIETLSFDIPSDIILKLKSGFVYNGDDRYTGVGHVRCPNGDIYEGEIEDGLYNGKGTMTYADNSGYYSGDWEDGKFNGKGAYSYTKKRSDGTIWTMDFLGN